MDNVSLLTIPTNLLDPGSYIEFDNSRASGALPALPRRILCLGQRLTTGRVAAGVLTRVLGNGDGKVFFGRGSMLAAMVEAKFNADTSTEMWCIASDDNAGGVAAIWHYTFAGPATAAGTYSLYIGTTGAGLTTGPVVSFAVPSGMTAAQAATALAAAITALPDLPVTAAVDGSVTSQVNITMKWKGLTGNDLDIRGHYYRGDQPPDGLVGTLAVATAGTLNPVLTAAIAAMGSKWFTDVINPYNDTVSMAAISAEMERRWGSTVQQDGLIYQMTPVSLGSASTLGASLNEKLQSVVSIPAMPTPSWVAAAVIGTMAAYYLAIDPAAPLDSSIILPGLLAPASSDQLQHPDREALLHDGMSNTLVDQSGNVTFNRMITTYQVNAQGIPDQSYLDVESMATLAYLRYWVRARIASRWPRYKLANDPVGSARFPSGQRTTCPKLIALDLIAGAGDLYAAGIIDDPADFAAQLVVVRNATNRGEVDSILPYTLIGRFRVFGGQIQFRT